MASFNKVILLGNLTRDVDLKYTPKGTAVAQLGLAVNRVYNNDQGEKCEEVTFVDVNLFGRTAEIANEYLSKGKPVLIEGRLKLDSWKDKQTDKTMTKLKVIGESLQLLGSKPDSKSQEQTEEDPKPPPRRPPPPQDPDLDQPEDDIPF